MKNTLSDLNNHLFEQLERLNDEDLEGENLDKELRRSEGMTKIAEQSYEMESSLIKQWCIWMNITIIRKEKHRKC